MYNEILLFYFRKIKSWILQILNNFLLYIDVFFVTINKYDDTVEHKITYIRKYIVILKIKEMHYV